MELDERSTTRVFLGLAIAVVVLVAVVGGLWRWRASTAPVSQTAQAPVLHKHILGAQIERWPDAVDRWDDFAIELANIARVQETLGDRADVLRGFDIDNAETADLDALLSVVQEAAAAGLFNAAGRIATIRVAARPFDELSPEDLLIGALWDGPREATFLQRAQSTRAYVAARRDGPGMDVRMSALDQSLRLAEIMSWQGGTLEYVYAWRIASGAMATERALLRLALVRDDALLRAIDTRIAQFEDDFAPATHVIGGDRIVTMDSLERMHTAGGHLDNRRAAEWDGAMASMGFDQNAYRGPLTESLAWLERFVEAANASAEARGTAIPGADAALDALHHAFADLGDGPSERWPALMITLSEYAEPITWERQMRIEAAGTRVAIALERYRLVHDRLPSSLDALGELLPEGLEVDPVTLQAWDYQPTDGGYTLSSRTLPGYESDREAGSDPLLSVRIIDHPE